MNTSPQVLSADAACAHTDRRRISTDRRQARGLQHQLSGERRRDDTDRRKAIALAQAITCLAQNAAACDNAEIESTLAGQAWNRALAEYEAAEADWSEARAARAKARAAMVKAQARVEELKRG